jgi:signal transduction histidine kinase
MISLDGVGIVEAALSRSVLVGRAVATVTAAGTGLLIVADPLPLVALIGAVLILTIAEIAVLAYWPAVVARPVAVVVVDSVGLAGALVLAGPGLAYFAYAAGCTALAGALLGLRAIPVWVVQAAVGFAVAAEFLEVTRPVSEIAVFVLAIPPATLLAGIGLAGIRNLVITHVERTVHVVASAQRSAVASERSRLARELHDSVTKTLRGVSFAALALPASMRRHPALAEQLASTVSEGADAAVDQARQLMAGLRLDRADQDFVDTIEEMCREWSQSCGIDIELVLQQVEPPLEARYDLTRILHEALVNVERHAGARKVTVSLVRSGVILQLSIADDGIGLPRRLQGPASGHFGIMGMKERAKAVGGVLRLDSTAGVGSIVTVTLPFRPGAAGVPALGEVRSDHLRQQSVPSQHRRIPRRRGGV